MAHESLTSLMADAAGVVFDKDGTLVDLDARWHQFFADIVDEVATRSGDRSLAPALRRVLGLADVGLVPDGPAAVESADEIGTRIITELTSRGHEAGAALDMVREAADTARFGPVVPIGDVSGALGALADHGYRLGLATSDGVDNTHSELDTLGLAGVFDPVRCADDGGAVKPDPAVLLDIATGWDVGPADVVFVGDSRQDLATAQAAGARFIARCSTGAIPEWATEHADAIVTDIGELAGLRQVGEPRRHDTNNDTEVMRR